MYQLGAFTACSGAEIVPFYNGHAQASSRSIYCYTSACCTTPNNKKIIGFILF